MSPPFRDACFREFLVGNISNLLWTVCDTFHPFRLQQHDFDQLGRGSRERADHEHSPILGRWELDVLRTLYPKISTKHLARSLGRTESAIYGKAAGMGLRKSAEYLASADACRLRRGDNVGAA